MSLAERAREIAAAANNSQEVLARRRAAERDAAAVARMQGYFPDAEVRLLPSATVVTGGKRTSDYGGFPTYTRSVATVRRIAVDDVVIQEAEAPSVGRFTMYVEVKCRDCGKLAPSKDNYGAGGLHIYSGVVTDTQMVEIGAALERPTRCGDCHLRHMKAHCDRCGQGLAQ